MLPIHGKDNNNIKKKEEGKEKKKMKEKLNPNPLLDQNKLQLN